MNSSHTSSRRFLWIFVFSFFLLSVSVYAAIFYLPWSNNSWGQIEEKVENGFAVTQGTSKEINVWGECKKVTAGSSMNVYVPTKTQNEWNQFKAHAGNIGATVGDCATACTGATPCGSPGSCYAVSGCDNTCGSSAVNDCAWTCGGSAIDYNGGAVWCGTPPPGACSWSTPCGSPGSCYAVSGCDNTCGSSAVNDCAWTCGGSAIDYNGGTVWCGTPPPGACSWGNVGVGEIHPWGTVTTGPGCFGGDLNNPPTCDAARDGSSILCHDGGNDYFRYTCSCGTPSPSCSGATPCGTPGSCYTVSGCDSVCGSVKVNDSCWVCGGDGSSCAPPINWVCSTTAFSCSAGILDPTLNEATPKGSYPRGCYYDWSCDGSNGGIQKSCTKTVGCFAPDELVKTLLGETKISELKVWDKIISYDETQNKFIENIIDKIIIHDGISSPLNDFEKYPLLSLVVETAGKKKTTKVTSNHLYFSPESWKYKYIDDFSIGEKVQSIDGIWYIISKTRLDSQPIVYNLHMKNSPNNYLVNGVVVHNEKAEACSGCIGPTCNAISAWLLMN